MRSRTTQPQQASSPAAAEPSVTHVPPALPPNPHPDDLPPGAQRLQITHVRGAKEITVTLGKMVFYPVKYNGFEVGPISMTVELGPDDDVVERTAEVRGMLIGLFEAEFERWSNAFADQLKRVSRGG